MNIYHGSKTIIEEPIFKGSNHSNDYGPAFYLTKDLEAAKSWACKDDSVGLVNKYQIRESYFSTLRVLNLTNKDKYSVLNWIAILMHFRTLNSSFKKNNELVLNWLSKYYIDIDEYDVIIGFRADDSYFRFPLRFISGDLSFEDLENVFKSGNLGIQYAFISQRALSALKFEGIIECDPSFVGLHYSIVKLASEKFDVLINRPKDPRKTYILDLMRKDDE